MYIYTGLLSCASGGVYHPYSSHSEATLHGHTMAVTSVDWRQVADDQSILATCSDDRVSIIIYMHNILQRNNH